MADRFARHSRPILRTARWKVLRQQILERDGWTCSCGCGRRTRLEVDHIQPVRTHPHLAFDPANLQTLAAHCHTHKTRIELGHKPIDPKRHEWRSAVDDLAAQPSGNGEHHA